MMKKIQHYFHVLIWKLQGNESRIEYYRKLGAKIGNGCSISRDVEFGTEPYLIEIGDNVRLTSNVQFITHDGSLWVLRNLGKVPLNTDMFGKITIGSNVNIGWNSIVLPNVHIGNNVIIGVNAVVTKNIPDNSVAVGVPARVIEGIDEYFDKNSASFVATKGMNEKDRKDYILSHLDRIDL